MSKRLFNIRTMIAVLVLILLGLQYRYWYGRGGLHQLNQLRQQVAKAQSKEDQLEARNAAVSKEVSALKVGDHALEQQARDDFGMVEQGEEYYQLVEKSHKDTHEDTSQ